MPKLLPWDQHKEELHSLYVVQNHTLKDIMATMSSEYNFHASERAYKSRFEIWNFQKQNHRAPLHEDQRLVALVSDFYKRNMCSKSMIRCLAIHQYNLTATQLRDLRLHPSIRLLKGTAPTSEARESAKQIAENYVQQHLLSGQSIQFGRTYTLTNIRMDGIFVSQHQVRDALRSVDPDGTEARRLALRRQRGKYLVKGPGRVLSIDGHDKLSRFGFQIYGAIDAYSRYIVWCYVGISNRTAVSVNKQYLQMVRSTGKIPKLIRSDKGTETVLLARSHTLLRRAARPNLSFEKAYSFGKSVKNQRIEAWWNILTDGQTESWKQYFARLENDDLFQEDKIDVACLQFIYMDMLRIHIHRFVGVHNNHPIRKQAKRDHYLPTGKPFEMYFYPESEVNYNRPVDYNVLQQLESEVAQYDLDDFLPPVTLDLFKSFLLSGGFPSYFSYQDNHEQAYLFLRREVWKFVVAGGEVIVYHQPTGAEGWIAQNMLEQEILGHADVELGDKKLKIDDTDDEEISTGGGIGGGELELDEDLVDYESGDDDQLVLDIKT